MLQCRGLKWTYCLLVGLLSFSSTVIASQNSDSLSVILGEIEALENKSDPKCYATASRLEDFMFGTPLDDGARFEKHKLQKQWLIKLWQDVSKTHTPQSKSSLKAADLKPAINLIFQYRHDEKGHWLLVFSNDNQIKIHKDDKRQYSSIAYSLRSLLAVQQEAMLEQDAQYIPLEQSAVNLLTEALDLYALAVLKVSDTQARNHDQFEIDKDNLLGVWHGLMGLSEQQTKTTTPVIKAKGQRTPSQLTLLKSIIEQKVRSYAEYNEISNQLFVRNLQVFFARNRWPADSAEAKAFRQMFTETLIAFAADLYKGAQQVAIEKGHAFIQEADVSEFTQRFIPHRMNEYEDAIFFPKLAKDEQITIEAYDMDAFRDSGIHWRYLQFAVFDPSFQAFVEPDPFAAELLVENIAQFGVLILRMTGDVGKEQGAKRIALKHFEQAMGLLQARIKRHKSIKDTNESADVLTSSNSIATTTKANGQFFTDTTSSSGIDYMHRSADWLNRLLRSYLSIDENNATITIPPAFGGAGVAASDLNNDELPDLLLVGGLGNHIFINQGNGKFERLSERDGVNWLRPEDNNPGEVRQPLIADLDNDGLQDIVLTYVNDKHRVYKNLGNGKFKDVTELANLGGIDKVGGPATVFDFDNDGLLDIYITYFGNYLKGVLPSLKRRNDNGMPNKLFKNMGGFRFKDVSSNSGLENTGWGQAVTHTDLNKDGMQDLIVGNDFGVNAYYINLGNGKFKDVSAELGTDKPSYTMGIGLADLNDDQHADVYISNIVTMNKDQKYVLPESDTEMQFNPNKLATMRVVEANDLFISQAKGSQPLSYKMSKAVGRGYSSTGWSWDADFFDFDNDGDDDLYVLNGMNEFNLYSSDNPYYTEPLENKKLNVYIPVAAKESNVFFVNENGRLNNVSKQSGADLLGNSRSAVYLDMDNDGDLDMVLNNYHEKAVVYRNNMEKLARNWLKVKLIGAPEHNINRDAIGAEIIVETSDNQRRWREVHGSIGYMSVHPKTQHFGLGDHTKVNIKIKWPNGKVTRLNDVAANQQLVVDYKRQVSGESGQDAE